MTEIISADTRQLERLAARFRESQKAAYQALQREIAAIGEDTIAAGARQRAGWSKKIPPTIRTSAKGLRVKVTAGNADVPIARWFEQGTLAGGKPWRHPVFPSRKVPRSRWHWVAQKDPHRPFLQPALDAAAETAAERLADAAVRAITDTLDTGG